MRIIILVLIIASVAGISTGDNFPPGISSFEVSSNPIKAGDTVSLGWYVYGADSVTIDNGIGDVEFLDTLSISPSETTTYTLTATNDAGSITATAECVVQQEQPEELTLTNIVSEAGNVWAGNWNYNTQVGDDADNSGSQAFLSFDISGIPSGYRVEDARIEFADYYVESDNTFRSLGCLGAYPVDYGNHVNPSYYFYYPPSTEPVLTFCSRNDLENTIGEMMLAEAIQQKIGSSRFQLRFQFPERESDYDGIYEGVDLGHNAKLLLIISPQVNFIYQDPVYFGENMTAPSHLFPQDNTPNPSMDSKKDVRYWQNQGNEYYKKKSYQLCLECYEKAININPETADLWYNKGNALFKLGKLEEALSAYNAATSINPKLKQAWWNKCSILKRLGRNSEAEDACSKAK